MRLWKRAWESGETRGSIHSQISATRNLQCEWSMCFDLTLCYAS